jgi:hypothetical protein
MLWAAPQAIAQSPWVTRAYERRLGFFLGARQVTSPYDHSVTSFDGSAGIGQADPYLC